MFLFLPFNINFLSRDPVHSFCKIETEIVNPRYLRDILGGVVLDVADWGLDVADWGE